MEAVKYHPTKLRIAQPRVTRPPRLSRPRVDYYARGFQDGAVGAMRNTGPEQYHIGYDDGLDEYDRRNPQ